VAGDLRAGKHLTVNCELVVERCLFIERVNKGIVVVQTRRQAEVVRLQCELGILQIFVSIDETWIPRRHPIGIEASENPRSAITGEIVILE
jgi:hypothetical protein